MLKTTQNHGPYGKQSARHCTLTTPMAKKTNAVIPLCTKMLALTFAVINYVVLHQDDCFEKTA